MQFLFAVVAGFVNLSADAFESTWAAVIWVKAVFEFFQIVARDFHFLVAVSKDEIYQKQKTLEL
jgi:hypothetical protein